MEAVMWRFCCLKRFALVLVVCDKMTVAWREEVRLPFMRVDVARPMCQLPSGLNLKARIECL